MEDVNVLKSSAKSDLFICRACIDEVSRKLGKRGLTDIPGIVGDADLQRIVSSCDDAAACAARFGDSNEAALCNAALKIGLMELVESQMAAVERHVLSSVGSRAAAAPAADATSGDAPQMVSRVPTFLRLVRTTVKLKTQLDRAQQDLAAMKKLPSTAPMTPSGGKLRPMGVGFSENLRSTVNAAGASSSSADATLAALRDVVATPAGTAALIAALADPIYAPVTAGCAASAIAEMKEAATRSMEKASTRGREQVRKLNEELARLRKEVSENKAARVAHEDSLSALRRDAEGRRTSEEQASASLVTQLADATALAAQHAAAAATAEERARAAAEAKVASAATAALDRVASLTAELAEARADAAQWQAHAEERKSDAEHDAAATTAQTTQHATELTRVSADRDMKAEECVALNAQLSALTAEVEATRARMPKIENLLERVQSLEETKAQVVVLTGERDAARAELTSVQAAAAADGAMAEKLAAAVARADAAAVQLAESTDLSDQLDEAQATSRRHEKQLVRERAASKKMEEKRETRVRELEQKLRRVEEQMRGVKGKVDDLEAELLAAQEELAEKEREMESMANDALKRVAARDSTYTDSFEEGAFNTCFGDASTNFPLTFFPSFKFIPHSFLQSHYSNAG